MELLDGSGESIEKIGMDSAMLVQCGGGEFDHFTATGGHFGQRGTAVIEEPTFGMLNESYSPAVAIAMKFCTNILTLICFLSMMMEKTP